LLDIDASAVTGPLSLFQTRRFEEREFRELTALLANATGLADERHRLNFKAAWPRLEQDVESDVDQLRAKKRRAAKRRTR
jgi:hypothetical protein